MRKIISLSIILSLCFMMLMGCGKAKTEPETTQEETETDAEPIWETLRAEYSRVYPTRIEENLQSGMPTDAESWLVDGEIDLDLYEWWDRIVPGNILEMLSNEQLVNLVLENRNAWGICSYEDEWEYGYLKAVSLSNVFDYMIERPGIENTLYEVYMSRNLEDEITDYPKTFGQDQFLEATLAQDVIYNSFTDEQKENVKNKVKEASEMRKENELELHCVFSLMSHNVWSVFDMIRPHNYYIK